MNGPYFVVLWNTSILKVYYIITDGLTVRTYYLMMCQFDQREVKNRYQIIFFLNIQSL